MGKDGGWGKERANEAGETKETNKQKETKPLGTERNFQRHTTFFWEESLRTVVG